MKPPFNKNLHGLRGVAAMAVFLFHWGSSIGFFPQARRAWQIEIGTAQWDLGWFLDLGWMGVPLFFVLSGYLLTSQLISQPLDRPVIAQFWLRRFLRIFPAYWLQLSVLLVLGMTLSFMPTLEGTADIVSHLFLWLNLPLNMTKPLNPVWWTLPVELAFYLLLPGLVWIARRTGWKAVVVAALALTVLWRYLVMQHFAGDDLTVHIAVLDSIPGTLFTFCAGFAIAYIAYNNSAPEPGSRTRLFLLSAVLFLLMTQWLQASLDVYWSGHWMLAVWNPLTAAIIAMTVLALLWPLGGFGWLSSRPMVWMGNVSYGIYLWHYPVLMALQRSVLSEWTTPGLALMALLVSLPITLLLAWISFVVVERPMMQVGRPAA